MTTTLGKDEVRPIQGPQQGGNRAQPPLPSQQGRADNRPPEPMARQTRSTRQERARQAAHEAAQRQDREAERHAKALANYDLVRSIAHRLHSRLPRSVDVDDLISAGVTGLMEAIDRYDASRSVPFEVFAKPRIQGAIVDMLRSLDWVPRTVRRRAELISETRESLHRRLGRSPNRKEMAKAIEVTPNDFDRMVRNSQVRTVLSLDTPTHSENPTPLIDQLSDEFDMLDEWQHEELKGLVVDAIRRLPDRERTAVRMYYLDECPLMEVGAALGVSESRASQLHRRGIERLKFKIREHLEG